MGHLTRMSVHVTFLLLQQRKAKGKKSTNRRVTEDRVTGESTKILYVYLEEVPYTLRVPFLM